MTSPATFRLTRYFLLTSLVGMVILLPSLYFYYRAIAFDDLMEHETRANEALTRALSNVIWGRHADFIASSRSMGREKLMASDEIQALRAEVLSQMRGLPVIKIKLYNPSGDTIFSTDETQIGENEYEEPGFKQAISGRPISEITFRNKFNAIESVISDRNVISTYIPVRKDAHSIIEGVFEVYSDVTPLVRDLEQSQLRIALGVTTGLSILYLFLFIIVRRADSILRTQEAERAASAEIVRHQAYHDPLTGLSNRTSFTERLERAIHGQRGKSNTFALMFLDLNRFKLVNDSLGHDAGDALLKEVAGRIHSCVRDCDAVFRMGGDEFTILLGDLQDENDAVIVAERIVKALAEPVRLKEQNVATGTSIGIAIYPRDGDKAEDLIKNADTAMYRAKESGTSCYMFFRPDMNTQAMDRLKLEADLQQALLREEFELFYQPRIDLASARTVGVEALLRWRHPTRGLLGPGTFIERLEETRMIVPAGEWVLRTACQQARQLQLNGYPDLCLSVNVSGHQFRPGYLKAVVEDALAQSGLAPEHLQLELTETTLFEHNEQSVVLAEELRILGVHIAIDDFGTGYSSINYLKSFPIDHLKIDHSLIRDVASKEEDRAILRTIASLAHTMGMSLVAEGVESPDQIPFLAELGCSELQGFLFSPPLPFDQLREALDTIQHTGILITMQEYAGPISRTSSPATTS